MLVRLMPVKAVSRQNACPAFRSSSAVFQCQSDICPSNICARELLIETMSSPKYTIDHATREGKYITEAQSLQSGLTLQKTFPTSSPSSTNWPSTKKQSTK